MYSGAHARQAGLKNVTKAKKHAPTARNMTLPKKDHYVRRGRNSPFPGKREAVGICTTQKQETLTKHHLSHTKALSSHNPCRRDSDLSRSSQILHWHRRQRRPNAMASENSLPDGLLVDDPKMAYTQKVQLDPHLHSLPLHSLGFVSAVFDPRCAFWGVGGLIGLL